MSSKSNRIKVLKTRPISSADTAEFLVGFLQKNESAEQPEYQEEEEEQEEDSNKAIEVSDDVKIQLQQIVYSIDPSVFEENE